METSFGSSSNSIHPAFNNNHVGSEVITISNDSGSEGMFEPSIEGETFSSGSLDVIISNIGGIVNCVKVPMPPSTLSKEEIQVNLQRRNRARDFIQTRLWTVASNGESIGVYWLT